jgi:hypothetical protein
MEGGGVEQGLGGYSFPTPADAGMTVIASG